MLLILTFQHLLTMPEDDSAAVVANILMDMSASQGRLRWKFAVVHIKYKGSANEGKFLQV